MPSLNYVSAWVEVDGKELEQHGVEEDPDNNQATCWIATQADKNFSVVFRDDTTYREHCICSNLTLDGLRIAGKVLHPPTGIGNSSSAARTVAQNHQVLSATSSRPFIFSKLKLTEDDKYLNQASTHLGEIRICIYRAQYLGSRLYKSAVKASGYAKIHERSKKAVTHCVSYGKEAETPTQFAATVRYLDEGAPFVTFIFKYRDFGLLQANGIIPKPPPARKKAIVSEDVLDLTIGDDVKREQIDEDVEIVDDIPRNQKKTTALAKRSRSSRESETKPAKRVKRGKFVPSGEVIDLSLT